MRTRELSTRLELRKARTEYLPTMTVYGMVLLNVLAGQFQITDNKNRTLKVVDIISEILTLQLPEINA